MTSSIQQRYERAMDRLAVQLQEDEAILAAVLCGSLAHDRVWRRSDIDLIVVAVDDPKKVTERGYALVEDDINIHTNVMRRESFRRMIEASRRNSIQHSLLAKGRLLFSKDEALARHFDGIAELGDQDRRIHVLSLLEFVLPSLDKAHKWVAVKQDYSYAALYVLYAATGLASIEVTLAGELAGREVIQQALALNPDFFHLVYTDLFGKKPTEQRLRHVLDAIDRYLLERREALFEPVLAYLRDSATPRSVTEMAHDFSRTHGVESVLGICEWLCDQGLLFKAGTPCKLTRRSSIQVQELAFGVSS